MIRVTIAVPEALVADANQLARCVGYSEADGDTFGAATHQNAAGSLFAVASGMVEPEFVSDAVSPLSEPPWGADMEAAERAQAVIVLTDVEAPTLAADGQIMAQVGDDVASVIVAWGLTAI